MPAEILRLSNFDFVNQSARSQVSVAAQSDQATIQLQSLAGFVDERFVVIAPATEYAELHQIDSLTGSTLTLKDNLAHTHQPGVQVVQLLGNQLKVHRAPNVDGTEPNSFDHYSGSTPTNPIDIQADQTFTAVTDPDGGPDYWYKVTYYNSITENETDPSLSVAVRGGDHGHYASLTEIREQAGFSIFDYVTDAQVSMARSQAESEINAIIAGRGYAMPITGDVPILTSITQMLGAGHLLSRSYGSGAEGTTKDGAALVKQARALLTQIMEGSLQLVDASGTVLPNTANSSGVDTAAECAFREPTFRIGDVF